MARTSVPDGSNFFVRCNLAQPPQTREPLTGTPERSLKVATDELLSLIERAIARIGQGAGTEASLHEIGATLQELKAMVARDPGIGMAAEDLHAAATALVAGQDVRPEAVDVRRWRLLREADARLRARLVSAQPSEMAQRLGLN